MFYVPGLFKLPVLAYSQGLGVEENPLGLTAPGEIDGGPMAVAIAVEEEAQVVFARFEMDKLYHRRGGLSGYNVAFLVEELKEIGLPLGVGEIESESAVVLRLRDFYIPSGRVGLMAIDVGYRLVAHLDGVLLARLGFPLGVENIGMIGERLEGDGVVVETVAGKDCNTAQRLLVGDDGIVEAELQRVVVGMLVAEIGRGNQSWSYSRPGSEFHLQRIGLVLADAERGVLQNQTQAVATLAERPERNRVAMGVKAPGHFARKELNLGVGQGQQGRNAGYALLDESVACDALFGREWRRQ